MRRPLLLAAAALSLAGCQTTAEKSAELEREAKRHERALAANSVSIARASTILRPVQTAFVSDAEGAAVVVTVRNSSARAIVDAPLKVDVRDLHGSTLYSNAGTGLAHSLISLAYVPAHGQATWVDDQASGTAGTVAAEVGEGRTVRGAAPAIALTGIHQLEAGAGVSGTASNRSDVEQRELVVYGVARRGGRIVAAGRAVVPALAAHASTSFQIYFIGSAKGAQLALWAPPTTFA